MKNVQDLINKSISPITAEIMNFKRGAFSPLVTWSSEIKPKAEFKALKLVKTTTAQIRAGINYANMQSVKDAIANDERGEVGPLPWGEWENFGYTITHKGERYVRLTPTLNSKPSVIFSVNGKQVSRSEFAAYLTPSDSKKLLNPEPPACFTVKERGLIGIGQLES